MWFKNGLKAQKLLARFNRTVRKKLSKHLVVSAICTIFA